MMKKLLLLLTILALALCAVPASATTTTWMVTGTSADGHPIEAFAKFTTSAGTVTVDIWNTQADPTSVGQDISDLGFVLDTGQSTGSIGSYSAIARTINDTTKAYTDVAATTSHWHLDTGVSFGASGTGLKLNDLGGGTPVNTIIGPPNGSDLYSNANSSITGVHSPEWFGDKTTPVEFLLNVSGVTDLSTVTFVQFSFGTEAGDNHEGSQVPIPPSALLMGSGLLGLVGLGWRRQVRS